MASWVIKGRWHNWSWTLVKLLAVFIWKEASIQLVPKWKTRLRANQKNKAFLCSPTSVNSKHGGVYGKIRHQLVYCKIGCFLFSSLIYVERWQKEQDRIFGEARHPCSVTFSIKCEQTLGWNSSFPEQLGCVQQFQSEMNVWIFISLQRWLFWTDFSL